MSDTTPDVSPAQPAEAAAINFERADFAEPVREHVACGLCKRAITTEYWHCLDKVVCDACREVVRQMAENARRGATFGKALLLGGGVAFACGIGYAIFVGVTHFQFALVTIGIGWAVGRSIQRVTRGFSARRHQVLAVALTYLASTMGYFPTILDAIRSSGDRTEQHTAATSAPVPFLSPSPPSAATGSAPTTEAPPPQASADGPSASQEGGGVASLVITVVFAGVLMLAAPFLDIASGLSGVLGVLIIFFGLRTAWRVSKGVDASFTGPHKISASAGS